MFLKIQNGSGNREQTLNKDVLDMEMSWRSIAMNLHLKETLSYSIHFTDGALAYGSLILII
jgi:hypothetical protein